MTAKDKNKLYGVLAQFESAAEIYHACQKIQESGFSKWDAYSPFPVHGLQKVMKIEESKLPIIVMFTSLICGTGGFATWVWMNGIDYKYVIAGKPFLGLLGYFLPGFECAVLSAAIACLLGLFALNKHPQWYHPLFRSQIFKQATNNKFFVAIETSDTKFDSLETVAFLKELGASQVEFVEL